MDPARDYIRHLEIKGYSPTTVKIHSNSLRKFLDWMGTRGIEEPRQVTREIMDAYSRQVRLYQRRFALKKKKPRRGHRRST